MKTKGFTLIELLAVIVILAIIALIAVPLIMDLISKSKKGAFVDSAYAIVKAAELTMLETIEDNNFSELEFTYSNGVETPSLAGTSLQYKGQRPTSGKVLIDKEGNVSLALYDGGVCATKSFVDSVIQSMETSEDDCKLLPFQDSSLASIPEVSSGMIPITWDGTKWVKADTSKEWFNYNQKKWANVVLVAESSRSNYQTGNPGMEIEEDDVLAYFVWIPRYRYQLFNVESESMDPISIQIEFEDKNTNKSDGMVNGVHTNGEWYTHPAFEFGVGNDINGFWVGKFETTGTSNQATIKPGLTHINNLPVKEYYTLSQTFNDLVLYGNDKESYMLKNTQWGSISYLSHSKYGSNQSIWHNPTNQTGCAGEQEKALQTLTCEYAYQTNNGMRASTTGNIYGVYDMAGGGWEAVMAVQYQTSSHTNLPIQLSEFAESALNSASFAKYINKYAYGTTSEDAQAYARRILGDATGETLSWYTNGVRFIDHSGSWMYRGGTYSSSTLQNGIFGFWRGQGQSAPSHTMRVVISD